MSQPSIAGRPIIVVEQHAAGCRVSAWQPPQGVWQQFGPAHEFYDHLSAIRVAATLVLIHRAASVLSHNDFPPDVAADVQANAASRLAAQHAQKPDEFVRIQPLANGARLDVVILPRVDQPPVLALSERLPNLDQARALGLKLAQRCDLPLVLEPADALAPVAETGE